MKNNLLRESVLDYTILKVKGEMSKFQRCGHQLAAEVGNKW